MTTYTILIIIMLSFIIISFGCFIKIYSLNRKLKYADEANMWHRLAITDNLTGLNNRNAYNIQLAKIKENTKKNFYILILFDIDNFKNINDKEGHYAGDKALQAFSKVLLEMFSEPEYMVFRIGGDEFSVISENVCEDEIIQKLINFKNELEKNCEIYTSIGYAIIKDNIKQAFKYADEMLYADKLNKNTN